MLINLLWFGSIYAVFSVSFLFVSTIIIFNIYCMWAADVSFIHSQLALIITEIFCLITVTIPCFILNGLLDPTWSQSMDSPFNLTNAIVFILCAISGFGANNLLSKQLNKFHTIKWKRKKLWYTLCIVYFTVGITGSIATDMTNLFICLIYQITLVTSGMIIIYATSIMLKRKAARKLYLENKYLLSENILLNEYYKTIEYQIDRSRSLYAEIKKMRDELQDITLDTDKKQELAEYINELNSMLDKEIADGQILLHTQKDSSKTAV